jgi:hypothetical protein
MSSNNNDTIIQLVQDLKQSDLTLNKPLENNYQSRHKKVNKYRLINEYDYIKPRRKKGKNYE